MKKIIYIIILCALLLSGCNDNKGVNNMSDKYKSTIENSISANELISKSINIQQFSENRLDLPYNLQGGLSLALIIENVKDTIGLECLRNNKNSVYSVHKYTNESGQSGYCFISYDSEVVIDSWFVIIIPKKSDFLGIIKNKTTLEEIKQLDPATIIFEGDEPISYHRFIDGTIMEIEYTINKGDMIVKDYGVNKDPSNIVKNLLSIDLDLVK